MADPPDNKELKSIADSEATAQPLRHEQPLYIDGTVKEQLGLENVAHSLSDTDFEKEKNEEAQTTNLQQAQSYATSAGTVSPTTTRATESASRRPWRKRLNPLKWGKIPPVPEVRSVSREYNASFLSLVYFQWMAPLMSVSTYPELQSVALIIRRWDTNGHSNKTTSGKSIPTGAQRR